VCGGDEEGAVAGTVAVTWAVTGMVGAVERPGKVGLEGRSGRVDLELDQPNLSAALANTIDQENWTTTSANKVGQQQIGQPSWPTKFAKKTWPEKMPSKPCQQHWQTCVGSHDFLPG